MTLPRAWALAALLAASAATGGAQSLPGSDLDAAAPRAAPPAAAPVEPSAPAPASPATAGPLSSAAEAVYAEARPRLLQIRTLVQSAGGQTTIGSGFLVSARGFALTNYHVVSQYALEPATYRLEYVAPDGTSGPLKLHAIDVANDLAVVQVVLLLVAATMVTSNIVVDVIYGWIDPRLRRGHVGGH